MAALEMLLCSEGSRYLVFFKRQGIVLDVWKAISAPWGGSSLWLVTTVHAVDFRHCKVAIGWRQLHHHCNKHACKAHHLVNLVVEKILTGVSDLSFSFVNFLCRVWITWNAISQVTRATCATCSSYGIMFLEVSTGKRPIDPKCFLHLGIRQRHSGLKGSQVSISILWTTGSDDQYRLRPYSFFYPRVEDLRWSSSFLLVSSASAQMNHLVDGWQWANERCFCETEQSIKGLQQTVSNTTGRRIRTCE